MSYRDGWQPCASSVGPFLHVSAAGNAIVNNSSFVAIIAQRYSHVSFPFVLFFEMKCIKISFRGTDKFVVAEETETESIVCATKKKIGTDGNISIKDGNYTEIDEDVLAFYCQSKEEPFLRIFLEGDPPEISFGSTSDIEIVFENRTDTPSSVSTEVSAVSTNSLYEVEQVEEDDLKSLLIKNGGQYIIDQYQQTEMLTDRCRIQLVNIVANILYQKYGTKVPKAVKMDYAKKLVECFPRYKHVDSTAGGYEIFFNPQANGGYLANRLRTVNRIYKEQNDSSAQKQRKVIQVTKTKQVEKTEELQMKLEHMNDINLDDEVIRESMRETFDYRNEVRNNISVLELFPRFLDVTGLVEQDFVLIFPESSNNFQHLFMEERNKIWQIFKQTSSNSMSVEHMAYDETIQTFIALLKLIPPGPKGKRKQDILSPILSFQKLFIFHQLPLPIEETINKIKNQQPYII